jgi:hypothetical protein
VQVWPPTFILKFAVPLDEGVPVILKTKEPFPLAKVPLDKDSVKPVIPVELIVCVL